MYEMATRLLVLHARTPLHPPTRPPNRVVDQPGQREVHTEFPLIAATGLKGALRAKAERAFSQEPAAVKILFGPDTQAASEGAGAVAVTDARCLAFPVRSLQQVFVWVTCPLVLRRLGRDLALAGGGGPPSPPPVAAGIALCASRFDAPLVLEELALAVRTDADWQTAAAQIAALAPPDVQADLRERLVLVSDGDFKHFVRYCTQVSARIALGPRKTTSDGGNLWYEETLPPESLFYGLLLADRPRVAEGSAMSAADVLDKLSDLLERAPYLQVGGNETVGQGWCRVRLHGAGEGR